MDLFESLKINEKILRAVKELGFESMTPIQASSLPVILEGKDIIAQAPTGTGKTACYAIPAIQGIDVDNREVQVVALCPTRELAIQVTNEIDRFARFYEDVKVITIYGGQSIEVQFRGLKKKPQIVVGTPGRVLDHLKRGTLKIDQIKMLILDEADEMLAMGFREDLDDILKRVKTPHQTLLFSATIPDEIKRITKEYQKDATFVRTLFHETAVPEIDQFYVELLEKNKIDCLSRMIDTYNFKQALVFCRTKKKVDDISLALTSRGYVVESLHGDIKQAGREKVIGMFREGLIRVLIATDVAARGLDIEGIDAVFNYDITDDVEYYIHRIGRTARAGRTGVAYTFVTKRELPRIKEFEKKLKVPIIKISPPTYEMAESNKIRNILMDLIGEMKKSDLKTYINYIDTAITEADQEIEPIEIAAGFLKTLVDKDSKYKDLGANIEITKSERKKKREVQTPDNYERLFINLGRKDELTKGSLLDLVFQKSPIEKSEIKGIDIMNSFSFFEVPKVKVPVIINTLTKMDYNGRKVDVEIALGTNSKKEKHGSKKTSTKKNGGEIKKRKQSSSKRREKSSKRADIRW